MKYREIISEHSNLAFKPLYDKMQAGSLGREGK